MRLLDLYCGAGGAGKGYAIAGFEVVGVDINPQPNYPFEFHKADALEFLAKYGKEFKVIHASPPCQGYGQTRFVVSCIDKQYPRLLKRTRDMLKMTNALWVVENVPGAPMLNPIVICGTALGLRVRRHRLFDSSTPLISPGSCEHGDQDLGVYANKITRLGTRAKAYVAGSGRIHYRPKTTTIAAGYKAMGIEWMTMKELCEAIPPAYTEWIGKQLMERL